MLTVFHDNAAAMKFYKSKLRYVLDETDPSYFGEEANYQVLSKALVRS